LGIRFWGKERERVEEKKKQTEREKRIQIRVFSAEVIVHILVGGSEFVDIGFPEGGTRELHVGTGAIRRHVEALPLEQRMSLHAPVLVRRTHHCVTKLHLF